MELIKWFNVATLGVVLVVAVLYINTMTAETRHTMRWGFVLTAGGALGDSLAWIGPWHAGDVQWLWVPHTMFHLGLALLAYELSRGHGREFIDAIERRFQQWDGTDRRKVGND